MADSMVPQPQQSSWRVTSQTEQTQPNGLGQFVQGMMVAFITGNGVRGTVFVPDTQYNTDTVRQLISQKAAALDAVGSLSS